jgi:hypothetical protein
LNVGVAGAKQRFGVGNLSVTPDELVQVSHSSLRAGILGSLSKNAVLPTRRFQIGRRRSIPALRDDSLDVSRGIAKPTSACIWNLSEPEIRALTYPKHPILEMSKRSFGVSIQFLRGSGTANIRAGRTSSFASSNCDRETPPLESHRSQLQDCFPRTRSGGNRHRRYVHSIKASRTEW